MAIGTNKTVAQPSGASPTFQSFMPSYWDSILGENLYPNLYLYQFGTKRMVPRNFGLDIKIPRLVKQNIITEIVATSEGSAVATSRLSGEFISGTLRQFAGAYRHTDIVIMTALSDVITLSLRDIARDIAKRMDTHVSDQLSVGGQFIGGSGLTTGNVVTTTPLRASDLLTAAVRLDAADNPRPPDGHYPALVHPLQIYDLQSNLSGNSWLEINKATSDAAVSQLYRGEIGRIFGARIVTSTNARRITGKEGLSATTSGYRSLMFAPDAYYVTEINDMTAKTFVKQLGSAGALDPVNQIATVGAKVFFTAIKADWGSETRFARLVAGSALT